MEDSKVMDKPFYILFEKESGQVDWFVGLDGEPQPVGFDLEKATELAKNNCPKGVTYYVVTLEE